MGIKTAFQSLVKKWKFRTKTLPRRFEELQSQFETLLQEVHASNTLKLESLHNHNYEAAVSSIIQLQDNVCKISERIDDDICKEKTNRLAQAKRANDKFKDHTRYMSERTDELERQLDKINKSVNARIEEAFNQVKKQIEGTAGNIVAGVNLLGDEIHSIREEFKEVKKHASDAYDAAYKIQHTILDLDRIESLIEKGSSKYKEYLDQLKKDISTFKKTDNAIVRLAHLEERITLMEVNYREISHNGSGKITSRSIGTY